MLDRFESEQVRPTLHLQISGKKIPVNIAEACHLEKGQFPIHPPI